MFYTTSYCPRISLIMQQAKMIPRICKKAMARATAPISTNLSLTKSRNFCLHPTVYRLPDLLTHLALVLSVLQQLAGSADVPLTEIVAFLPVQSDCPSIPQQSKP